MIKWPKFVLLEKSCFTVCDRYSPWQHRHENSLTHTHGELSLQSPNSYFNSLSNFWIILVWRFMSTIQYKTFSALMQTMCMLRFFHRQKLFKDFRWEQLIKRKFISVCDLIQLLSQSPGSNHKAVLLFTFYWLFAKPLLSCDVCHCMKL